MVWVILLVDARTFIWSIVSSSTVVSGLKTYPGSLGSCIRLRFYFSLNWRSWSFVRLMKGDFLLVWSKKIGLELLVTSYDCMTVVK